MLRTTSQFFADLRSDLADRPDTQDGAGTFDTLWSDEDLLRYLNSAAARLASDTLALRKRLEIPLAAQAATARFPYWQILDFIRAEFVYDGAAGYGTSNYALKPFDIDEGMCTDDYGYGRMTFPDFGTAGTPRWYTRDYDNDFMRLYPIPQAAGKLVVFAIALPDPIYAGMPVPFQAQQDWDLLLMWAKAMAYSKQDADTLDLARAKAFEADYKRYMPDRKSEIDRVRRAGGILQER